MKNSTILSLSLLSVLAVPAAARNFEVTLNHASTDTKVTSPVSSKSETDRTLAGISYFFTPLSTGNGPLALSEFTGRNSSIHASFSQGEVDTQGSEYDLDAYNISGRYVNDSHGWFISAAGSKTLVDAPTSTETNDRSVSLGTYFAPTSIIELGITRSNDNEGKTSSYRLSNFHVESLGNDTHFDGGVALSYVDREHSDNGYVFELASTYYPSSTIGIGLNGSYSNIDDSDSYSYGAIAEWFILNQLSLNAAYMTSDADNDDMDIETDTLQVGIRARF